jgi:hypothetical protein
MNIHQQLLLWGEHNDNRLLTHTAILNYWTSSIIEFDDLPSLN